MPYINEHSARVHNPEKYERFARKNLTTGIDVIIGFIKGGGSEIQAYRFDKKKFTPDEAKRWLKEHKVNYISFEKANE